MAEPEQPQIYLITPPEIDAGAFPTARAVLDAMPVACLRLRWPPGTRTSPAPPMPAARWPMPATWPS